MYHPPDLCDRQRAARGPRRLHPHLAPFRGPAAGGRRPALMEVVLDEGRDVAVRLQDGRRRVLHGVQVRGQGALGVTW